MKKRKVLVVGLIGLLMAGVLILAGCDICSKAGDCEYIKSNGVTTKDVRCTTDSCSTNKTYNSSNGAYASSRCSC